MLCQANKPLNINKFCVKLSFYLFGTVTASVRKRYNTDTYRIYKALKIINLYRWNDCYFKKLI